ncbi:hypothetical protein [Opitutus sp. GAS368]|jgi:hypothetical protein|uniref:hypothetical protein n=1 Tax=Opitutus sp. GAS368 TaxID=1882749 RepID=UPI00087B5DE7|nr:hypothetical protein [Opitutus sp. GAS368]SDS56755.1 hypothetical protein SAMN05444173_3280 [Opitutus sp. GAS368]
MNPPPQAPAPRRPVWRWVLLGVGICLAPFLVLGAVALSYLTLDSDVRVLRQHLMAATDASWHTKVQMSLGRATLGAIGQGLRFVHAKDVADARLALRAVQHASVGVYERTSGGTDWSRERLFTETDRAMQKRGWSRLVGVVDQKETVLVYVQNDLADDEPVEICVAVVKDKEMVVASTTVDATALGELVAQHTGTDVKGRLRFAKLGF